MSGIYIHIPFCKQACSYCDFHFSTTQNLRPQLVKAITVELQNKVHLIDGPIASIYFGGGTPSILDKEELDLILNKCRSEFCIDEHAEITLEINPDDVNEDKFIHWKKAGINRLSIGTQSFHEEELKFMNRAHNSNEAIESIQLAQKHGFDNISIDLIYGVPNSSIASWKENLEQCIQLGVQHISAYCLTVENKTALKHWIENNKVELPKDELSSAQFDLLVETLENNGFEHYEISNFSITGKRSKHNTSYWQGKQYLGIGPSAHSFIKDGKKHYRSWNIANNPKYIEAIENNAEYSEIEELSSKDQFNEYVLTRLRTKEGMLKEDLALLLPKEHHNSFQLEVENYIRRGILLENERQLHLSQKGKFIADKVISDLFFI